MVSVLENILEASIFNFFRIYKADMHPGVSLGEVCKHFEDFTQL